MLEIRGYFIGNGCVDYGCGDGCEMEILDAGDGWWFDRDIDCAMEESMVELEKLS